MNAIDRLFRRLRGAKRKALILYLTAGFPDKSSFAALAANLQTAGADLLEVGVPFSDPIADGPTIQASSQQALRAGVTLNWIFDALRGLRGRLGIPVVLMSYANPVRAAGFERFFRKSAQAGVSGLIVPDLIPEEAGPFARSAARHGIYMIYLVAPTTPRARRRRLARMSRGFVYAVSLTGVTGARRRIPSDTTAFLEDLRRCAPRPVAVGFGISQPSQARELGRHADGVIVGSALIQRLKGGSGGWREALRFIRSLRRALDSIGGKPHAA